MTEATVLPLNLSDVGENPTDRIVVCIEGQDRYWNFDDFDLSFDDSESDILNRLRGPISETFNVDIRDGNSGWLYKTRKATDSRNIYLIPNSTAGF